MQEELRKKVVYEEQQVKYLQKEMDREHSFQLRIQRERKENQKKFKQFCIITEALVIVAVIALILTQGFKLDESSDPLMAIIFIIMGPIFVFAVMGLFISIPKAIHYGKQQKGTEDPRSSGYKTYEDMWLESRSRMKYLDRELIQNIVMLENNKNLLEERRQLETQGDHECISMNELYQLKKERE